ncbi:MAG: tryptophan-rich sensory protein [Clostridia bacterium]|nr:tryptophan-rich sensory protein [Clostridia bacterium]
MVDYIKKLTGIVSGLFITLVGAWICASCLKIDFKWYYSLVKPIVVPTSLGFSIIVSVVYICCILVFSRLIVGKHFFPSVVFMVLCEMFSALFIFAFFRLENLYLALFFIICTFTVSFVTEIRFFIKDIRTAIYYLPVVAFNAYSLILVMAIVFAN